MSRKNIIVLLSILLISSILLAGCSSSSKGVAEQIGDTVAGVLPTDNSIAPSYPSHQDKGGSAIPDYDSEQSTSQNADNLINLYERKMIKNGYIIISSNKPKDLETQIINTLKDCQGYIVNTSQSGNDENYHSELIVKIPYEEFDMFIVKIKDFGEVKHTDISTQDVTEEYIDLEARKNTLKVQEQRLIEMLGKAENVEELLKVENELSRIRYELEKVEGRIRYLNNSVSYSTLRISIQQKVEPTKPQVDSVWDEIWFSFTDGIGTFFNAILVFVKGIVWLLPFLVVGVPIILIVYKKKFKK